MRESGSSHNDGASWTPDREVGEWAASGAMSITGREDGPPLGPPAGLVPKLHRVADDLGRLAARHGSGVEIDPVALLGERAAIAGLTRRGDTSCGGATRLLPTADGWIAVALARTDDVELVPAWLERECGDDAWQVIADSATTRSAADLVGRGRMLGLPVAMLPATGDAHRHDGGGSAAPERAPHAIPVGGPAPRDKPLEEIVVADLSALWAGPLCGSLLAMAGAQVVKVESTARPDGARQGPTAFFDLVNGGKRSVALDLTDVQGRRLLGELLGRVDVVIEASRPRALEQLGIDAMAMVAGGGPRVWVSLTGYGREGRERDWVAFGDDAAAAGGLVVWDARGPCFCADAVADPLSGLVAAREALGALTRGGRWLLDVPLAGIAAGMAGPTLAPEAAPRAEPPRARRAAAPAAPLGADTDAVLRDLGVAS